MLILKVSMFRSDHQEVSKEDINKVEVLEPLLIW